MSFFNYLFDDRDVLDNTYARKSFVMGRRENLNVPGFRFS